MWIGVRLDWQILWKRFEEIVVDNDDDNVVIRISWFFGVVKHQFFFGVRFKRKMVKTKRRRLHQRVQTPPFVLTL